MWVKTIYQAIMDALFPLSKVEEQLLSYTPVQAYSLLPPAPPSPIPETFAVFAYKDERVAKLIWSIKYKKSKQAVELGGYALYQKLIAQKMPPGTVIVPIPITPRRRRERGYNL
jgi:predicted amidophosphoribosyltransferase